ncbi:hypothetical protein J2810_001883 [Chryseobacterium rhizosphaerae]|uniref:hypothetical protein n=1 Tax=Chryseobacterium rhizosphaerae TaxID=395937 RepID=UPI0028550A05|nr:hypothetical protein [Chryseobacterium rhizosphaerae]MDR6545835.1 hypothetical protein [Chryseobacterium rhizosphaerae]
MKKLNVSQMENLQGGTNRQCLIDGILTTVAIACGAGLLGAIGGLYAGNSNGCF